MKMTARRPKGFTLMELMIVVAIIGIIAAIAIPNLLLALQRAKQRRTMVDLKNIALAWESRNVEVYRYNAAGASYDGAGQVTDFTAVVAVISPTYMKTVPSVDAWGNPYVTYLDRAFGDPLPAQKYALISGGKDGTVDTAAIPGPITNFDCDIVFGNGTFLSYPDGINLK